MNDSCFALAMVPGTRNRSLSIFAKKFRNLISEISKVKKKICSFIETAITSSSTILKLSITAFKLTRNFFLLLLLLCFASCDKRLNEVTVKTADVEVTKYEISEISTAHDFIEVRKGNSAMTVLETNSYGFADIIISNDTIVIQYLPNVFYKIEDKAFNYKVKLDTTISVDYWRKKVEEREKLKK